MASLHVRMEFESMKDFKTHFQKYQDCEKQSFTKRSSIPSNGKQFKHRNINENMFPFAYIIYTCKFGGKRYTSESQQLRQTKWVF